MCLCAVLVRGADAQPRGNGKDFLSVITRGDPARCARKRRETESSTACDEAGAKSGSFYPRSAAGI